jgi:hypothetical protein
VGKALFMMFAHSSQLETVWIPYGQLVACKLLLLLPAVLLRLLAAAGVHEAVLATSVPLAATAADNGPTHQQQRCSVDELRGSQSNLYLPDSVSLLLPQVRGEFRRFAVANYLSTYYLHSLNIESGLLGRPPPPGHWRSVAALLQARWARLFSLLYHLFWEGGCV